MRLWPNQRATISPHEDYGFFGPGSVTWKVRQRARVFDEGLAPSDDGIVESEPILGSIA